MIFKPKYEWKNFSYPVKPDDAAEELRRIQDKYGEVTAKNLLDESRPKGAVMHNCYEWDNKKAAEKYRLWQSKNIMSNLTIVYETADVGTETVKKLEVRAFQNTSEEREGRFIHVQDAMEDPEYRRAVLERAFRELAMFRRKYADLQELSQIFKDIDEMIAV